MASGEEGEGLERDKDGIEEEVAAYQKEARKGIWKKIAGFVMDLFNAWW